MTYLVVGAGLVLGLWWNSYGGSLHGTGCVV